MAKNMNKSQVLINHNDPLTTKLGIHLTFFLNPPHTHFSFSYSFLSFLFTGTPLPLHGQSAFHVWEEVPHIQSFDHPPLLRRCCLGGPEGVDPSFHLLCLPAADSKIWRDRCVCVKLELPVKYVRLVFVHTGALRRISNSRRNAIKPHVEKCTEAGDILHSDVWQYQNCPATVRAFPSWNVGQVGFKQ